MQFTIKVGLKNIIRHCFRGKTQWCCTLVRKYTSCIHAHSGRTFVGKFYSCFTPMHQAFDAKVITAKLFRQSCSMHIFPDYVITFFFFSFLTILFELAFCIFAHKFDDVRAWLPLKCDLPSRQDQKILKVEVFAIKVITEKLLREKTVPCMLSLATLLYSYFLAILFELAWCFDLRKFNMTQREREWYECMVCFKIVAEQQEPASDRAEADAEGEGEWIFILFLLKTICVA